MAAAADTAALAAATDHYLEHEFNLLGSGWVRVAHGTVCAGVEDVRFAAGQPVSADQGGAWLAGRVNAANLSESRRIWGMLDPGYAPIDWQLDFKSGYRWSEATWYRNVVYGRVRGADVKVPWELGRLQHLPQLALAAVGALNHGDSRRAGALSREIRNEALDFIATNPPRFGVNWAVTMDVAIRAANLLVARDILASAGLRFDAPADAVLRRSVLEHGRHIADNLEWRPAVRANHYLADIVGLLFVAVWLGRHREAGPWLAMARHELLAELDLQFNRDGTNFEGSTAYHGLATELAIAGIALLAGTKAGAPAGIGPRLQSMVEFTEALTGPGGLVTQFGDNDSGRLFKLDCAQPGRSLDQRHLRAALCGLLDTEPAPVSSVEGTLVRGLAGGRRRRTAAPIDGLASAFPESAVATVGDGSSIAAVMARIDALPVSARASYVIPSGGADLTMGLVLRAFPDGGYWIARSPSIHLAIRCGPIGRRGGGGHDHLDQLSLDLWIEDEHVLADPGSYLYTPAPELRNAYRSASAHTGPRSTADDGAAFDGGLFVLDARGGECLAFGDDGFAGAVTEDSGRTSLAVIRWLPDRVEINHGIENGELHADRRSSDWRVLIPTVPFSPGYGLRGDMSS